MLYNKSIDKIVAEVFGPRKLLGLERCCEHGSDGPFLAIGLIFIRAINAVETDTFRV